jgi:hypothetical protein
VLLAFLPFLASPLQAQTAEEMVSRCKAVTEGKIDADGIQFVENYDSGVCWGAFGTLQTISGFTANGDRILNTGCLPKESTRSQIITVFVEYARRNPQRLHENFVLVAMDALRGSFPCQLKP